MNININAQKIISFIQSQPIKAVEMIDIANKKVKYSSSITSARNIEEITGEEEIVRALFLTKLVNEYGYSLEPMKLEDQK